MRKCIMLVFMMGLWVGGSLGLTGCKPASGGHEGRGETPVKPKYHCPMHPTFIRDQPGDCGICGMKLVPLKDDLSAQPAADTSDTSKEDDPIARVRPGQFYCPMGAEHVQDKPGQCPKCGMDLVEKKAATGGHEGPASGATNGPVPGRVRIGLSPEKRQLIGLALATVERRDSARTVRATAVVTHDETRYARIAPRFGGWVRKLHANFTGAPIEKGQPMFTVYSPELFSTENEYLIAWQGLQQLPAAAPQDQRRRSAAMVESARRRLELWEVGAEEIRALEQRGAAVDEMLFRSPISGHIVAKSAVEGKAFLAGESLYEVAELSHLWLDAWVFESDFPLMKVGLKGTVTFPYLGNQTFRTAITFLYPHIDPQTRRGRVRLELDNPEDRLRPEMWANVAIEIERGKRLLVPTSAVIDTGQRLVAFVDGQDGRLEPRELEVGFRFDDDYEVLAGVAEGEKVVTRALFLVDSESQLKAAIAALGGGGGHPH